jgi:hypothetical protein
MMVRERLTHLNSIGPKVAILVVVSSIVKALERRRVIGARGAAMSSGDSFAIASGTTRFVLWRRMRGRVTPGA